jgi:hypothetical protein
VRAGETYIAILSLYYHRESTMMPGAPEERAEPDHNAQEEDGFLLLPDPAEVAGDNGNDSSSNNGNDDSGPAENSQSCLGRYMDWMKDDSNLPTLLILFVVAPYYEELVHYVFALQTDDDPPPLLKCVFAIGGIAGVGSVVLTTFAVIITMWTTIIWRTYRTFLDVQSWYRQEPPIMPWDHVARTLAKWILIMATLVVLLIWYNSEKHRDMPLVVTGVVVSTFGVSFWVAAVQEMTKKALLYTFFIFFAMGALAVARSLALYSPAFQRFVRARWPVL